MSTLASPASRALHEVVPRAAQPRSWSDRILRSGSWFAGLTLVLTVLAGLVTTAVFHGRAHDRAHAELKAEVARLAAELDRVVDEGLISGALRIMGTSDERLKERLTQGRAVELASRALAMDVDGLMLIDGQGRVVEAWDPDHTRSTAPMWEPQAPQGDRPTGREESIVQVVIDSSSLDHSLLLVAPVWASTQAQPRNASQVIGTVAARLDPGTVRRYVAMSKARITLLAPNGRLVAASTAQGALRRPAQASEYTAQAGRHPLPPDEGGVGASRLIVRHDLAWNTGSASGNASARGSGPWSILVTQDLPPIDWITGPQVRPTLIVLLVLPALAMALFKMIRVRADRQAAREQLSEQALQSASEARRRRQVGHIALEFQGSSSCETVAFLYLRHCHEWLGAARGVAYRMEPSGALRLAAQWACADRPERIECGSGLLGQAVIDRQIIDLRLNPAARDAAEAAGPIVSALGRHEPLHRMVLPLIHMGQCLGVVELEWLSTGDEDRRERTVELTELLALNWRLLGSRP